MLALEKTPSTLLSGKLQPTNAAERAEYAQLCVFSQRFAASARLYAEALTDPKLPDNLQTDHRYNAACIAALAGCGQGKDAAALDAKERERLRNQALAWLRADLEVWIRHLEKEPAKSVPIIVKQMQHWLADTDFAGVRGPDALGKLPEVERQAWQKLWADVADTLAKAIRCRKPEAGQEVSRSFSPLPQSFLDALSPFRRCERSGIHGEKLR